MQIKTGAPSLTASAETVGVQPPSNVGGDVAAGAESANWRYRAMRRAAWV